MPIQDETQGSIYRIRLARLTDAVQIAGLAGQLGYPSSEEQVRLRLEQILEQRNQVVFVAQAANGVLIGWAEVVERIIVVADRHAQLEGLVVDEHWRSKGVGAALLRQSESWARQRGCSLFTVRTNVIRHAAHLFYEHVGYQKIKSQYTYQKNLD